VRSAALVLGALGLVGIWFLLSPGDREVSQSVRAAPVSVVRPAPRHPARPLWLEQADREPEVDSPSEGPAEPVAPEFEVQASPLQVDPESAIDHEAMHTEAWDDLVEKLAAAGEDPERFREAMEMASEQRWALEE
jgi:hypothetical protein